VFNKLKKEKMKKAIVIIVCVLFAITGWSQPKNNIPLIGSEAPAFKAKTTNGDLNFPKDFGNSWKILLSHPKDFTPVCTSEILQLAEMQKDFETLGVKLAIISTDVLSQHQTWKLSIEEIKREGKESVHIKFPLIEDSDAEISKKYGMIHEPISTTKDVRGVFVIDENNIVQSVNFYPMSVGRNMEELKRLVIALQTSKKNQVSTPANWVPGDDVLIGYRPYTDQQLKENPALADLYYQVGNSMWYKRMNKE
jgi:peroxiredoxin 2/4